MIRPENAPVTEIASVPFRWQGFRFLEIKSGGTPDPLRSLHKARSDLRKRRVVKSAGFAL